MVVLLEMTLVVRDPMKLITVFKGEDQFFHNRVRNLADGELELRIGLGFWSE